MVEVEVPTTSSCPHGDTSKQDEGSAATCAWRSMDSMPVLASCSHTTTQQPCRLFMSV